MENTRVGKMQIPPGSSVQEYATVIAVGEKVTRHNEDIDASIKKNAETIAKGNYKIYDLEHIDSKLPQVGEKLFIKTWAVDIVTRGEEKYYFIDATVDGELNPAICAAVTELQVEPVTP